MASIVREYTQTVGQKISNPNLKEAMIKLASPRQKDKAKIAADITIAIEKGERGDALAVIRIFDEYARRTFVKDIGGKERNAINEAVLRKMGSSLSASQRASVQRIASGLGQGDMDGVEAGIGEFVETIDSTDEKARAYFQSALTSPAPAQKPGKKKS